MTKRHLCEACPIRARHDRSPRSLVGRFWRWHITFCPGWKAYIRSLDEETRHALKETYGLKKI